MHIRCSLAMQKHATQFFASLFSLFMDFAPANIQTLRWHSFRWIAVKTKHLKPFKHIRQFFIALNPLFHALTDPLDF